MDTRKSSICFVNPSPRQVQLATEARWPNKRSADRRSSVGLRMDRRPRWHIPPTVRVPRCSNTEFQRLRHSCDWLSSHLESHEFAWAIAGLNGSSQLGVSDVPLALSTGYGGGPFFVNQAVGFVDLPLGPNSTYSAFTISQSTAGADRWGDFVVVRNDDSEGVFLTAGFRVVPSSSSGTGKTSQAYYVTFSRA
jgi:hypothetical protein